MKKTTVVLLVLLFALAVAFVSIQAKGNGGLESVYAFAPENLELPEGIVIDKSGYMYVSVGPPGFVGGGYGGIFKISPDGAEATMLFEYPAGPAPAGLAVDPSGKVFYALPDFGSPIGGVFYLTDDGDPVRLPGTENSLVPNGLALDKHGNLFFSDSALGAIWRVPADGSAPAEIWLQHELVAGCTPEDFGANGIAFWKSGMYVANTGRGALVYVPVANDGSPGEPEMVAGNMDCVPEGLFGMDGIALDVHGDVYAMLVLQNMIVKIDPDDGSYTTLLTGEDGLWNPASIAFGTGKGDRESIFITNYAVIPPGSELFGPAVLKYDVGVAGLPLP
jgi:sugar lactone lactonase YvrE